MTISLQFPTGRYVAASWNDKNAVEWPPHPARLCLGLLDALHRSGNAPDERAALEWLCAQSAPEIAVPSEASETAMVASGVFVPQNRHEKKTGEKHPRKERSFPAVHLDPDRPTIFFHWPDAADGETHRVPLGRLLSSLPRFGHSSSLVIAGVGGAPSAEGDWRFLEPANPNLGTTPERQLRIPWDGIIASAESAYQASERLEEMDGLIDAAESKPRRTSTLIKPPASPRGRHDPVHHWCGYSEPSDETVAGSTWSPQVLLLQQSGGSRLGLDSTWQLIETLHKTILDRWSRAYPCDRIPAWISGHASAELGNVPARHCHLAMFPLPFVEHKNADGHLLGLGLALPRTAGIQISPGEQRANWRKVLASLFSGGEPLQLIPKNKAWDIQLQIVASPQPPWALVPSRWIRPAKIWESVTPIILHRHPKPHFRKNPVAWRASCEKILRDACLQLGLPEPLEVEPFLVSPIPGVPPSGQFIAPGKRAGRPPRFHLHARFHFEEEIEGPVLLGAGRYRGYGLCIPRDEGGVNAP